MANLGTNEGFRVLDDFVCEAVHAPNILRADSGKQGRNEGMLVVQDVDLNSPPASVESKLVEGLEGGRRRRARARVVRVTSKAACIAVASGLGSVVGGWMGASVAAILSSAFFLGESESA